MRISPQILPQISTTIRQPRCRKTAFRVALVVGTLLFTINHGSAFLADEMDRTRWLSAMLSYCVPFMVSIHGQSSSQKASRQRVCG